MNRIASASFVAALGLASLSALAAAAKVDVPLPAELKSAGYLTVGINCTYPPAGYVGFDGKPAGYEYTLVKRIAEFAFGTAEGLRTQCVNDSNRIPFLQAGKIDLLLASLAYTPARAEQLDYSNPIWVSNLQLIVPKDSKVADYSDLAGKTVITPTGSTYQTWLQKCYPQAQLNTVQTAAEGATMLTQGRGDAFAYIDVYGFNFTQMQKNYKVVGTLAASAVQGVGVKKGNKPMLDWINAVLEQMRSEDAFYNAFAQEVKAPTFVAKYRQLVPGPNNKMDYSKSGALDCLK
ncbi:transporter substrate-binding domain-containing protein [Paracidovorax cattleyae]|uniref:Amino acid ABC transporter substrate-binding protein, PAAT family n=1 Tax=Paracidovorax cattleyae TaxID=80868 RepID=A0A1H0MDB8_9BURK|nr:transporter substrate-binding domain-containing protein [Paracidovorax cattleyae]MBF9264077.1 transporter substrate-binding domain-containing protein [Paracidovorax cattleyae]SDO78305.1 amino acid ABC transporter substrate-binding protein, PAAT family [Paracidovorax cattleyae]